MGHVHISLRDRASIIFSEPRHDDDDDGDSLEGQQVPSDATDLEMPIKPVPVADYSPSITETISKITASLKQGKGILEAVLATAYANAESRLKTTVGLEVKF